MADRENWGMLELSEGGNETMRLRLFFLAPLTLVIMLAIGLFSYEYYSSQQKEVESGAVKIQASASVDFTRFSRHMIMSKLKRSEANERHEIYSRIQSGSSQTSH